MPPTAQALRRAHERDASIVYDAAIRIRPDLYHRTNVRATRSKRGHMINQVCSIPPKGWDVVAAEAAAFGRRAEERRAAVRGWLLWQRDGPRVLRGLP